MSDLPLQPPVMIFVIGLPGSGKTYFARRLSEQYDLGYISENRVRYELFDNPSFNASENQVIYRLSDMMLENCLSAKSTFIYENSLSKTRRQEISRSATKKGFKVLTVWVQTDVQTSFTRATKRDKRRPDDKYSQAISKDIFDKAQCNFSPPSDKELSVVISGKFAYKSQQLAVVRKLMHVYGGDTLSAVAAQRTQQTRHII